MGLVIFILLSPLLYTYVIYPVILGLLASFRGRTVFSTHILDHPKVSVIVPVYNAEKFVESKIENLLATDYPADKIEFLFVSDGSTDKTNSIIESYKQIKLIKLNKRVGKEAALKVAVSQAKANIICLSDVSTHINASGLFNMVRHFSNKKIGAVSSIDKIDNLKYFLDNFLFHYEFFIRDKESILSSCVGVSGSCFTTRKEIFMEIDNECCSDLGIAFECEKQGYKTISEHGAIGTYQNAINIKTEFKRNVRTITHGMFTVANYKELLNITKHGFFSWQLISHKIARWITPISLLILMFYLIFKIASHISPEQLYYIIPAMLLLSLIPLVRKQVLSNIGLFILYSIAILTAFYNVITRNKVTKWEPTRR